MIQQSTEKLLTIELFGQRYTFRVEKETLRVNEVADLLVKEVKQIESQTSTSSTSPSKFTILTLAALNITSNYIELKQQHVELKQKISNGCTSLIKQIDPIL